jgi:hypothetical protein
MRVVDVLGILFWATLFVIAAIRLKASKRSTSEIAQDVIMSLVVVLPLLGIAAVMGFAIGGTTGMIGNSLLAALWAAWGVMMWVSSRKAKEGQAWGSQRTETPTTHESRG